MTMFESSRPFSVIPLQTITIFTCLATAAYMITLVLYRLFFHPLYSYPGPRLAAATGWYETYYDCLRGGKFSKHIDELHEEYGNIVRISPQELHIQDPEFFDKFYTSSNALDKDPWYYNFAGIPRSTFATSSALLHRQRRAAIARSFATTPAVSKHIEACTERLLDRLKALRKEGPPGSQIVHMSSMFWMLASDIVSGIMLPRGTDYMTSPETAPGYLRMFKTLARVALWHRHFSLVFDLLSSLPRFILDRSAKPFTEVLKMQDDILSQILSTTQTPSLPTPGGKPTLLSTILLASNLPPSETYPLRLLEETTMILGAGTEAVGAALSIATYHILSSPTCSARLTAELSRLKSTTHIPTPGTNYPAERKIISYTLLQKHCPYLLATIKESLRLSLESNRLPRLSSTPTSYNRHLIPAGTKISLSLRDVHLSPTTYPSPQTFNPERWLQGPTSLELERRYLVPFGKGSRSCPGRAIAWEEMVVVLGNMFASLRTDDEMELWETTGEEDMKVAHDFFSSSSGGENTHVRREAGLKVRLL